MLKVPLGIHLFLYFFPIDDLGIFVENHLAIYLWIYFWSLCSVSLIYMSVYFFFSFFGHAMWLAGSQFPDQVSNPVKVLCPNYWATRVFPICVFLTPILYGLDSIASQYSLYKSDSVLQLSFSSSTLFWLFQVFLFPNKFQKELANFYK